MAVIDIISYNGEEDLLDLRLKTLGSSVDQFIIVEATETFSGKPKELRFNPEKFKSDKIKYHVVDDYPNDTILSGMAWESPGVPRGQTWWHREFYQKESIKKALTHLKDNDVCFVGDCDEIWNPAILKLPFDYENVYKMRQKVYAYYLNTRTSEDWTGTYVTNYRTIKNGCLNHLRTRHPWVIVENGGWHFTNMGGADEIRRKLESYGHQEFNTSEVKDNLEQAIAEGRDFIGRPFTMWLDETQWPEYLMGNRNRYAHLLK